MRRAPAMACNAPQVISLFIHAKRKRPTVSWVPEPIKVDGVIVGAAVRRESGIRFVAVDWRVGELDQTTWPSIGAVRSATRGAASPSP